MNKKTYRFTTGARLTNSIFKSMARLGLGARFRYILSVPGRTTGRIHSTPVDVMAEDGKRWLVAAYGVTGWVQNARVAGQVTLSGRGRSETVRVEELGVVESVPVLRKYLCEVPIVRPYFDATQTSTNELLAREVAQHPVFRVSPLGLGHLN